MILLKGLSGETFAHSTLDPGEGNNSYYTTTPSAQHPQPLPAQVLQPLLAQVLQPLLAQVLQVNISLGPLYILISD